MSSLHVWQDWTFTICGWVFAAGLAKTVLDRRSEVPRLTSVPTALGLLVVAFCDWTIHLPVSSLNTIITAAIWGFVAWRRPIRATSRSRKEHE
jgi:hypothetical protein